jgi:hypothetical protein
MGAPPPPLVFPFDTNHISSYYGLFFFIQSSLFLVSLRSSDELKQKNGNKIEFESKMSSLPPSPL